MKDRVPLYPGRIKLNPVSGQQNVFDMVRADEPQQEGTPINKKTLLTDETAFLLGLGENATPNEALKRLSSLLIFEQLGAKVEYGTYIGTGTYGEANPTTLNVGFKPLFFAVSQSRQRIYSFIGSTATRMEWTPSAEPLNPPVENYVTWGGNSVQWYCTVTTPVSGAANQMNAIRIYNYVVIGI